MSVSSESFVSYGKHLIKFRREPRSSKSRRVLIKVTPDGQVVAKVDPDVDDFSVVEAVTRRASWVWKQLEYFKNQASLMIPRKYISGESHYYLGKQYLLKVIQTTDEKQGVKLLRGKLEVKLREKSPEKVKQLLNAWYKNRAKDVLAKRLDVLLDQAIWVKHQPNIRILTMKTQWGSCSPKGNLTLNPSLVRAPRECIDYVILHELCHIAEHNHSERFYRLQNQVMPNWQKYKTLLDEKFGVLDA